MSAGREERRRVDEQKCPECQFASRPLARRGTRLSGRRLPRDAVAADQRRRIQAGAATAFANHGYVQASVGRIIEPARVSRRTFYELFASKDNAFLAAHEELLADLTARISAATAGPLPWPQRVAAAISAAMELAADFPERALLLTGDAFAVGPWAGHVHDALLARFGPALRRGRA
ncbi:MAG TPA: TetR/AcrR family transcriptional regulator, partial [Solirubrobacterales bacterium]|nr:TetR/AcrR family transcriptional regulator [Solirubrobacterales bacterium]